MQTLGGEGAEKETLEREPGTPGTRDAEQDRDWAPLLYAPAAGEAPAVAVRRPLAPARPPAPDRKWEAGDRAEVRFRSQVAHEVIPRLAFGRSVLCRSAVGVAGGWPPRRTIGNQATAYVNLHGRSSL